MQSPDLLQVDRAAKRDLVSPLTLDVCLRRLQAVSGTGSRRVGKDEIVIRPVHVEQLSSTEARFLLRTVCSGVGARLPMHAYLDVHGKLESQKKGTRLVFAVRAGWPSSTFEWVYMLSWYALLSFPLVVFSVRAYQTPTWEHVSAVGWTLLALAVHLAITWWNSKRGRGNLNDLMQQILSIHSVTSKQAPTRPPDWLDRLEEKRE